MTTRLIGPMNVTRAILPVMRTKRAGHIVTISSSAGLAGFEYGTAYAASKFGVDGWLESLDPEVEPFGIQAPTTAFQERKRGNGPRSHTWRRSWDCWLPNGRTRAGTADGCAS